MSCIQAIRDRYDGRRRSPFNEAECGHHYARAMAAWAAVLALTGFHYSAVTGHLTFTADEGSHFWSTGYAWARLVSKTATGRRITMNVQHGKLRLRHLTLKGQATKTFTKTRMLTAGQKLTVTV